MNQPLLIVLRVSAPSEYKLPVWTFWNNRICYISQTAVEVKHSHTEKKRKTRRCAWRSECAVSPSAWTWGFLLCGFSGLSARLRYERPPLSPPWGEWTANRGGAEIMHPIDSLVFPPIKLSSSLPVNFPQPSGISPTRSIPLPLCFCLNRDWPLKRIQWV